MKIILPALSFLALSSLIGGCAGQITTQTGISGPGAGPVKALAIAAPPEGSDKAAELAHSAVAEALARHGYAISADAPTRVEVAIAERGAPVAISRLAGADVAPARKRPFLGGCADKSQRLTVAVYPADGSEVTRVWAEEGHCKAALGEALPALADGIAAALQDPSRAGLSKRSGRN